MSSTAIQKLWAKDLAPSVVAMATAKAFEATRAWNSTVSGILAAAKAVHEVREAIGGKGSGSFSAWAVEELDWSQSTASRLAEIGSRHAEFIQARINLPSSWSTLYELARAPDDVRRRALRRVRPDMERNEVTCLLAEETEQPPLWPRRTNNDTQTTKPRALPAPSAPEPGPREAATTTIMAGSVWRHVKDFSDRVNTALASGALALEAKRFMVTNHLRPARELIEAMEKKLAESVDDQTQ